MIQLTITLHDEGDILAQHKKNAILEVLKEGEEELLLEFAFDVVETVNTQE